MKKALRLISLLLLSAPFAVWAFYKPVRVLAPEWTGQVSCPTPSLCIEDPATYDKAANLYAAAARSVADAVGPFQARPRMTFCVTQACYRAFGFRHASATTVGRFGIVISPRGWRAHYLRHEMIHHRQAEELGLFALLMQPQWLIEGMAYALSDDPRQPLAEPWQSARDRFAAWHLGLDDMNMWQAARDL